MSDLLNSSNTGPIDLNNIENQVQQNIANQAPVNDVVIDVPANTENQINLQIDPAPVTNWAGTNQVELNNTVIEQPQWTIDLDKIQWWISLDAMIDNDIQDIHIQPQQNGAEQQTQPAGLNQSNVQVQQPVKAKKHKKQSWFIILWVFWFLFVAGFVLYKMFPDKVMDLFKHDAIVQSLTWTENNDEEWNEVNVDENQWSELENNGEWNIWEEWENNENQWDEQSWEEIDPNSLAWLLEWNEDSGEWNENNEEWVVNGEEWNQLWSEEETSNWGDEWEFDPFSEMNELLGVDDENKSKLNDYISKWQYYIDWWTENSNAAAKRYWEAIVSSAQDQLTKLENWEEIDTTLFDRFDNYLKVLSDLESNN